jgi:hypothetical protein
MMNNHFKQGFEKTSGIMRKVLKKSKRLKEKVFGPYDPKARLDQLKAGRRDRDLVSKQLKKQKQEAWERKVYNPPKWRGEAR